MRGALGSARGHDINCQSTLWLAVALRGEIFYSTSCLNLAEHVFAYCSIVNNLLDGSWKAEAKVTFPFVFFHILYLLKLFKKIKWKNIILDFNFCSICNTPFENKTHCTVHVSNWYMLSTAFYYFRLPTTTPMIMKVNWLNIFVLVYIFFICHY